jgi:Vam6/Vps39-like protein vacuolar protein sorting-associated protein 39
MLSAFTARPIVELKARDKSKIESILAYGDRLLVGLSTGSLRIYRVNEVPISANEHHQQDGSAESIPSNGNESVEPQRVVPEQKIAELLREQEKFSKHKIEQLAIIKEANILISLSNGLVSIHDLQSYELQEQLTKTKGASAIAVNSYIVKDASTGVPSIVSRLAVAVKRRLLVWAWHDMELDQETAEIALVSGIKTLTWASGQKIVAGLSSGYVVVDVETKDIVQVVGPGSIGGQSGPERGVGMGVGALSYVGMGMAEPKPLATGLGDGEMLLAKDVNTHFTDRNGQALGRRQIPWRVAPEAIGYSYPFLLALQEASKGILEVRNPETLSLLQSISLPGANILQVAQPNISLAHAGKGFLVASDRTIWRMGALEYDSQIDALVEIGQLDEAISLLGMLEDSLIREKAGRMREIKMQKAQRLFDEKKFRDSLDLFAEVSAPPERVIKLYPKLIAGDLAQENTGNEEDEGEPTHTSPVKPATSKGHKKSESVAGSIDETPGSPRKPTSTKKHKKTDSSATANGSKPENLSISAVKKTISGDKSEASSIRSGTDGQPSETRLSEKELKVAVRELQSFLADIRRRLQRFFDQDQNVRNLAEVQSSDANANSRENPIETLENLFGVSDLHDIDVEQRLIDTAKLVDTTLFRAYMYAAPSMAGSLFRITNFCDPGVVMEKLEETGRYNDLIDFLFGKRLHRAALEMLKKFGAKEDKKDDPGEGDMTDNQLRGPARTVRYLQNLPPELIDLILEFAQWPIQSQPDLGMDVFLADTENAETLPRRKVLAFLEGIDKALALRYLEHVVDELNDLTPDLHQKLVMLYFEQLMERPVNTDPGSGNDAARQELKDKFFTMLRNSTQYSPAKVLGVLPKDDETFYEARAIVFSKMGQHKQALEIYVFKLKDFAKAEEYCNRVHLTEDTAPVEVTSMKSQYTRKKSTVDPMDEKPSIYNTLLNLYLNPPKGENSKPMWGPAIEVLARHGPRLPASETLELIPESLPVKELEFYFRGRIREANSVMCEARIVAGLRKVEAVRMQAGLLLGEGVPGANGGRMRNVRIDEERVCGVCYKRLGGSVISVFPEYAEVLSLSVSWVWLTDVVATRSCIWDVRTGGRLRQRRLKGAGAFDIMQLGRELRYPFSQRNENLLDCIKTCFVLPLQKGKYGTY